MKHNEKAIKEAFVINNATIAFTLRFIWLCVLFWSIFMDLTSNEIERYSLDKHSRLKIVVKYYCIYD